jgi:hypothetical protein
MAFAAGSVRVTLAAAALTSTKPVSSRVNVAFADLLDICLAVLRRIACLSCVKSAALAVKPPSRSAASNSS